LVGIRRTNRESKGDLGVVAFLIRPIVEAVRTANTVIAFWGFGPQNIFWSSVRTWVEVRSNITRHDSICRIFPDVAGNRNASILGTYGDLNSIIVPELPTPCGGKVSYGDFPARSGWDRINDGE
jgi:hypothetical protein